MHKKAEHRDSAFPEASLAVRWPPPPGIVTLEQSEIHLWCAAVGAFSVRAPEFEGLLSSEERIRARKFRFEKDREPFVIRRALLRLILSGYLEEPPALLKFRYGAAGKPEIDSEIETIHFNSSHSGGLALFGVTALGSIGVDIEYMRPIPRMEELAARFFPRRETENILALPVESRQEAFYACWTRKEALLKATGQGIGSELERIEVTVNPEEAAVVNWDGHLEGGQWSLRSVSPAPGYCGAVASQCSDLSLRQWAVPHDFGDRLGGVS